jgi:uncharacterized protein (TIGR02391 family)
MVPIDFHEYRNELRRALLTRAEALTETWDVFTVAWISYGLSVEGFENNQDLIKLHDRMLKWIKEERDKIWEWQRNLGPISTIVWLCRKRGEKEDSDLVTALSEKVKELDIDDKWSPLRDPEQVYLLSLGLRFGSEMAQNRLKHVAHQEMQKGPLRRKVLYAAALKELGETVTLPKGEPQDEADIIALVWWAERYDDDKYAFWDRFSSIKDHIVLDEESESDGQRVLSISEIAMLYEAVTREAINPSPVLLFRYYPIHPRIKELVKDHFVNKDYSSAVFEATKALSELIQQRSGLKNLPEVKLVNRSMLGVDGEGKQPCFSNVIIQFNDYLTEGELYAKNEQEGLALICKGVIKAFRHPRAHRPKDHPAIKLDAYEALDQLVIVSYLMRRVERAKIVDRNKVTT